MHSRALFVKLRSIQHWNTRGFIFAVSSLFLELPEYNHVESGTSSLSGLTPLKTGVRFMVNRIVTFSCTDSTNDSRVGVGSVRHYIGRDSMQKQIGTYEINAKVWHFFHP